MLIFLSVFGPEETVRKASECGSGGLVAVKWRGAARQLNQILNSLQPYQSLLNLLQAQEQIGVFAAATLLSERVVISFVDASKNPNLVAFSHPCCCFSTADLIVAMDLSLAEFVPEYFVADDVLTQHLAEVYGVREGKSGFPILDEHMILEFGMHYA
ncbi:unnamed protein product [Sphenostylis stenocarpa]|uniref:Uncharacterized protein n=1 Tax=Sphenostylis stenocarpa TaxID=92480 RepID=A0AA86SDV4_9FABA|nr:unnamed protein product [Sphenostylis stenocarpa]